MTTKTLEKSDLERLSSVALVHYARARERAARWNVSFEHLNEVKPSNAERNFWAKEVLASSALSKRMLEWTVECSLASTALMSHCATVDPEIRGGRMVLLGTGFTVAQTLAELASSSGVEEVAEDFDLNPETIRTMLNALSLAFERSWVRER